MLLLDSQVCSVPPLLCLDSKDILFLTVYLQTLERLSDRHPVAELVAVVGFMDISDMVASVGLVMDVTPRQSHVSMCVLFVTFTGSNVVAIKCSIDLVSF